MANRNHWREDWDKIGYIKQYTMPQQASKLIGS